MLEIKKKYLGKTMSNGKVKKFNTLDLEPCQFEYYYQNGFAHIFTKKKND